MKLLITQCTDCPSKIAMCKLLAKTLGISLATAKELTDKSKEGFEINFSKQITLSFANNCGLYGYAVECLIE